jgi:general secretion pathway protein A
LQRPFIDHQIMVSSSYQVLGEDIVMQRQQVRWKPIYLTAFGISIIVGAAIGLGIGA